MQFLGIQNQDAIYKKWSRLVNAGEKIQDETLRLSTAIVLENAQNSVDHQAKMSNGRSLLFENAYQAGVDTKGAMGPTGTSYADTMGDARVPSIVIPMIRRIFPQLLAHKLVGVQPMQAPIGMAFAFRAKYGRFAQGNPAAPADNHEIGYLYNDPTFTGKNAGLTRFNNDEPKQDQGAIDMDPFTSAGISGGAVSSIQNIVGGAASETAGYTVDNRAGKADMLSYFLGNRGDSVAAIGDGAETSTAENWAVGRDMPEAGFEILKATVTAKTRKLGVQITRETEEDMKAMQGLNAQQEVSEMLSYEIAQEIDRQLLGEIIQSAIRANNATVWNPATADGRNQNERVNALYTYILRKSADIAVKSRRGAANWCVASPSAAACLEAHIYNPLSVGGGLGNASAFGKDVDNGIGVTEIGALRNGTIKLYRDSLAGGDYILLGFKGNNIYDAGIIYLPYIPLELMQAQDPFTFNPITAARTRYGVTTNLFGAGQFYQFIGLEGLSSEFSREGTVVWF